MNNFHHKFFAITFMILVACVPSISKPDPNDPSKSTALGISITTKAIVKSIETSPDWVYFIKIDSDSDTSTQSELIKSNYATGNRIYLLNAEPGNYAVVASENEVKGSDADANVVFYSQETIEKTKTGTVDGEMVFMGDFVIGTGSGFPRGSVQEHYYDQWRKFNNRNDFLPVGNFGKIASLPIQVLKAMAGLGSELVYSGKFHTSQQDATARNSFLSKAAQDFEENPHWLAVIEKSKSR